MRDKDGSFNAGTMQQTNTDAASLNVLKAGDAMSGTLIISGIFPNKPSDTERVW